MTYLNEWRLRVLGGVAAAWPLFSALAGIAGVAVGVAVCATSAMAVFVGVLGIARLVLEQGSMSSWEDLGLCGMGAVLIGLCLLQIGITESMIGEVEDRAKRLADLLNGADSASVAGLLPEQECVEVFREQLRMTLVAVRIVIGRLHAEEANPTITLVIYGLNAEAKSMERGPERFTSEALARYLCTLRHTSAAALFDSAVADGACPLQMIEKLLGITL
jgi:hypothetical protein